MRVLDGQIDRFGTVCGVTEVQDYSSNLRKMDSATDGVKYKNSAHGYL